MFKKILIANRGEIACRVAATARRLGIQTVAVYSEADANAQHVKACDEAVLIGGPAPRDSYLQWQRILAAAKATGAQAVHPGYGFLSENEAFAQACADAGVVFIGPPPRAIQAMGLKAESKRLMEAAGVPLVPGYHGADQDPALLKREADRIGYPVLIKASAGGGGKGMRAVFSADEFDAALASCKREAINSFGDDAVLIERYVQRPRHIEIQVFGDTQGDCVYLFERDCSVQRRHQKVLEEAPAPGMTPERRAQMGEAAVAAAKAVGYVGAGTVEFIVEQDGPSAAPGRPKQASTPSGGSEAQPSAGVGNFYFMEMNTRLQVEHPVTEAITGQDLVEWQLRVAAGQPLPLKQHELRMHGHAIEARICAENPDGGFLPATGTLDVARWPDHVAFQRGDVRIDAGVREGDAISPFYDSMIAKLIVWGEDRAQALARLDAALRDTHIVGLHTNVAFLRRCAATASFAGADLDTGLIEREKAVLFDQPGLPLRVSAAAVVAHTLAVEAATQGSDPWSARDGFRLFGAATRRFDLAAGDTHHEVLLARHHRGGMTLTVEGEVIEFAVQSLDAETHELFLGQDRVRVKTYAQGERVAVFSAEGSAVLTEVDVIAHAGDGATEGGRLTAPMPGKLVAFLAQAGDTVSKGQPLAVMEAMKMEHTISSPRDGKVAELLFAVGDQVTDGAELLKLEA
ncbi:MAG: 3-methylcrotonyl-CoA carboxylase [Methylibium sp.]|nr:3-methylcrotonyl-CoA carboxylase [Methylibium sp.]MBY0365250.1 acetyl/propionyl/methylcrotonyl-CoA carboxylase subunit alpha [Burkholderiaceae bacterium]